MEIKQRIEKFAVQFYNKISLILHYFLGTILSNRSVHKIYNSQEHITQVMNVQAENLHSLKVRSLFITIGLFTLTHIFCNNGNGIDDIQ